MKKDVTLLQIALNYITNYKVRSTVIVCSIILTSVLFSSLFTLGIATKDSIEKSAMKQTGGEGHAALKYINDDIYKDIYIHDSIKKISYCLNVADEVMNEQLSSRRAELQYLDKVAVDLSLVELAEGSFPQKENQIALDTMALDLLGIKHDIGEKIPLILQVKGEVVNRSFTLSGYWEGDSAVPYSLMVVSKKYVLAHKNELTYTYPDDNFLAGTVQSNIIFNNASGFGEKTEKLLEDTGYQPFDPEKPKYIEIGINWAYMENSITNNKTGIIAVLGFASLIMVCGYLIISNIYELFSTQDIRLFGRLKTIGCTKKQIKYILRIQISILGAIGYFIGSLIGVGIGTLLVSPLTQNTIYAGTKVSFELSSSIFIFTFIFLVVTLFISTSKTTKRVSDIPPIEAAKFVFESSMDEKQQNDKETISIFTMALYGVKRNKKRVFIVIISLSMCLVLFNSIFSLKEGFDLEKFISSSIDYDYRIANTSYFNYEYTGEGDSVDTKDIEQIENLPGYEKGARLMYSGYDNNIDLNGTTIEASIYGADPYILNNLEIIEGKIPEHFDSGRYIIEGVYTDDYGNPELENSKVSIGDKILINSESEESQEYTVAAKVKVTNSNSSMIIMSDHNFYLPTDEYIEENIGRSIMCYVVGINDNETKRAEAWMKTYIKENPLLKYTSKQTYKNDYRNLEVAVSLIGGLLCVIVGIIGLVNCINTMVSNIISRNSELIILNAIGMTSKQIRLMLIIEDLIYAIGTTVISLVIMSFFSLIVIRIIGGSLWFFSYKFIMSPLLIGSIVLTLLILLSSQLIFNLTKKKRNINNVEWL